MRDEVSPPRDTIIAKATWVGLASAVMELEALRGTVTAERDEQARGNAHHQVQPPTVYFPASQ